MLKFYHLCNNIDDIYVCNFKSIYAINYDLSGVLEDLMIKIYKKD